MNTRLHKVIAKAGVASRREAERLITGGRVTVNGVQVTNVACDVDGEHDSISVDGVPLPEAPERVYYIFHKPRNVVVARKDPQKRPIIYDYLQDVPVLVHPAGRLDFDSEGLLLLSNDGALIQRLAHPSGGVRKTYHVKVKERVKATTMEKLLAGVPLEDGPGSALEVRLLKENPNNCWLEIVIGEGRNRIVRRLCEVVGHPVLRLVRVAIGTLQLGELPAGAVRLLTADELRELGVKEA